MIETTKHSTELLAENVRQAARDGAEDDYFAALFAPLAHRAAFVTLAAYAGEIARIPLSVREPQIGEIRLQWWRETIANGARTGHPVADAVVDLASRANLSAAVLTAPLDGLVHELYADPLADATAFETYLAAGEESLIIARLAVLGARVSDKEKKLLHDCALLTGQVRFLVRAPHLLARGRLPLPVDQVPVSFPERGVIPDNRAAICAALRTLCHTVATRSATVLGQLSSLPASVRPAVLHAALAQPYLRVLQRADHDPARDIAEVSALGRLVRLMRAAWFGSF